MANMNALSIDITQKLYDGTGSTPSHIAVESCTFSVQQSEFICLLGPSGCGKTTLLNMIAGLDVDFDGKIEFAPGISDNLVYVFQSPRLLPWRTVTENILLATCATENRKEFVAQLIADVGLEKFAHAYPSQLSLGMKRRAALARAFSCAPGLLLMDEPFVSLDEPAAEKLRELLMTLWKAKPTTVLFVTHDIREAVKMADRLVVLSRAPSRVIHEIDIPHDKRRKMRADEIETFRLENSARLSEMVEFSALTT
jgi:ABC-type nitrate/sulfonate/bicarbonate transport system ATPase subunit